MRSSKGRISATTDSGKASWHSLRKCFVNAVVRSGADLKTVMELHDTRRPLFQWRSTQVQMQPDCVRLRKRLLSI